MSKPPGIHAGVRLANGELALFPESIEEIIRESGEDIDPEAAMREMIARGDVRAKICSCNDLPYHWHFNQQWSAKALTGIPKCPECGTWHGGGHEPA